MEPDADKIDDAVLALLLLGLHEENRAWKGFDWDALNRLHEQGYISDPRSVVREGRTRHPRRQSRRCVELPTLCLALES
jgi:hypothetical protein